MFPQKSIQLPDFFQTNAFQCAYLVLLGIAFAAFVHLRYFPQMVKLSITMDADPQCSQMEIFYNSTPNLSLSPKNHLASKLQEEEGFHTYTQDVALPISFLRLDPCEGNSDVKIESLSLHHAENSFSVPTDFFHSWKCTNCTLIVQDDHIFVDSEGGDPYLYTTSFPTKIPGLPQTSRFLVYCALAVFLFLLALPFVLTKNFWLFLRHYWIPVALTLASTCAVYLSRSRILQILPRYGHEGIVGYARYHEYSYTADSIFFFFLILTPFMLACLFFFLRERVKRD